MRSNALDYVIQKLDTIPYKALNMYEVLPTRLAHSTDTINFYGFTAKRIMTDPIKTSSTGNVNFVPTENTGTEKQAGAAGTKKADGQRQEELEKEAIAHIPKSLDSASDILEVSVALKRQEVTIAVEGGVSSAQHRNLLKAAELLNP